MAMAWRSGRAAALWPAAVFAAMATAAGDGALAAEPTPQPITDPRARDAAQAADRNALLRQAEAALALGHSAAAAALFERAAGLLHAPDTEMGQVRTAMQQGRYRQALAFCAHTAGAHLESAPAGALYAWLLRVGGQVRMADRVLAQTLARSPDDPVALATQRAFADPWPRASGLLLVLPHRLAPEDFGTSTRGDGMSAMSSKARIVASGVLVDGGRRALVPLASIAAVGVAATNLMAERSPPSAAPASTGPTSAGPTEQRLWLRNGLGQATSGVVDRSVDGQADASSRALAERGIAVIELDTALPFDAAGDGPAAQDPFAGSPGFVVEYAVGDGAAAPAWPWLRQGFVGGLAGNGLRLLGIDLPAGPHGGLVMDARGRVAGLALPGPQGAATFVPASLWRGLGDGDDRMAPSPLAARPASPGGLAVPADAAYERGLRLALQVLVMAP